MPTPRSHTATSSTSSTDTTPAPIVSNLKLAFNASPPPAYVALAAASQLVTDNYTLVQHEHQAQSPPQLSTTFPDSAVFSTGGLAMINAFLDQLFYNFLLQAQGTSLAAIQAAIEHVLKGKLARCAIANANEELEELLSDDVDEDLAVAQETANHGTRMDIDAVFCRTRLRVMVYMRLGEMEDEDEEQYVDEAQITLQDSSARKRLSLSTGLVSWAAAIYLTSILEFVAEQCLSVAGQAAFDRSQTRRRSNSSTSTNGDTRVVVEEYDVERIALNATLGRLWRTWRKQLRNPHSRNVSTTASNSSARKTSQSFSRSPENESARSKGDRNLHTSTSPPSHSHEHSDDNSNKIDRRRESKSSMASDEGTRVNTVRIHRISQRPRSLLIARRISSLDDVSTPVLTPLAEHRTSAHLSRSNSLPSSVRAPMTPPPNPDYSTSARPATAPRPRLEPEPDISDHALTATAVRLVAPKEVRSAKNDFTNENKTSMPGTNVETIEENAPSVTRDASPASFLERAVATRKPNVDTRTENRALHTGNQQPVAVAIPLSRSGTGSLTSVRATVDSQPAIPPDTLGKDGLGVQYTAAARSVPASEPQGRARADLSSKSSLREPALRSAPSFDREDRSSVRRLSESSSRQSKLNKPSLEMFTNPESSQGQSGYLEKDFRDFMATQEPVKYTLTPKTLQDIEAPDTLRYMENSTKHQQQQRQQERSEYEYGLSSLTTAQLAVIANMNASLKNYPTSQHSAYDSTSMEGLRSNKSALTPPESLAIATQNGWTNDDGNTEKSLSPSRREPAESYSGWTSVRTSLDRSTRNGTNGSSPHMWPPTISAARKTSTSTLEPRDAGRAISGNRGDTYDLIQFLRSTGPPNGQSQRGSSVGNGDAQTVSSFPKRTSSSMTPSASESVNSNSALLGSALRSQTTRTAQNGGSEAIQEQDVDAMPIRRRKRIKDPYALPSDDEEIDEITELPTRTETLIDFLRNVDPPPRVVYSSVATKDPLPGTFIKGADSPVSRSIKNKGSIKPFWKKKINT